MRPLTHTGLIGEGHFIAWAASQSWGVYKALDASAPYDFIVDTGESLLRVEVKRAETLSKTGYYYADPKLDTRADRFDFIFISTPEACWWIPRVSCSTWQLALKPGLGSRRANKYDEFRVKGYS